MAELNSLIIFTDGGARDNPGPAAIGFVINQNQTLLYETAKTIGIATNNQAEYQALLEALTWIKTNVQKVDSIECRTDSQLMAFQLTGKYQLKSPPLIPLHQQILNLLKSFSVPYSINYIPRAQNKRADFLLNQALDSQL